MGSTNRPVYRKHTAFAFAAALGFAVAPALTPMLASPAFARGPDSLADLAANVSDAVVNISASQTVEDRRGTGAGPNVPGDTPFSDQIGRAHV